MVQHIKIFIRTHLFKASLLLAVISISAIAWGSMGLYQGLDYNRHLASKSISLQTNSHALLLNASLYNDHGQDEKALSTYAKLATKGNAQFAKTAYFNSGNT